MKLVIISGTPSKRGRTRIVSRFISETYHIDLIDLSTEQIPLNGEDEQDALPVVKKLRQLVHVADGVILATPEYHNGMSGAMKNALDFLSNKEFQRKPVALLAVSGGGKGGINAINNLRTVARGLYANAIPRQLVLDPVAIDRETEMIRPEYIAQVEVLIEELSDYVKVYNLLKQEVGN